MKRLLIPSIVLAMAMLACSISPLPVSTQEATEPPASGENLPAGFITALNGQPVQLNFYNTSGASLGSINAPSLAKIIVKQRAPAYVYLLKKPFIFLSFYF